MNLAESREFIREGDEIFSEVENLSSKERRKLSSDEVFIFIGVKPIMDLFQDKLEMDKWGLSKSIRT